MKTYAFDELLQGISEGFSSLKEKLKTTDLSQLRNKKGYIDLGGNGNNDYSETGSDYYLKWRPQGGNPRQDHLIRKDTLKVKSSSFKEFLTNQGEDSTKWQKVCETWEDANGDYYERHYWTNGTKSYYHI